MDTLFFRDGTPFHLGEGGSVQPRGSFPPSMMPLQGAIRTALARGRGWRPNHPNRWPEELGTPDDLGDLRLRGPFLRFGGERLYPIPLVLFGKWGAELTRLVPGEKVECDLGQVRLPRLAQPVTGKMLEGWLTQDGLESVLRGEMPAVTEILQPEKMWKEERRVGILRNVDTRKAEAHHLYTATHVRPVKDLMVEVDVQGIPEDWNPEASLTLPLGGEGRMAYVTVSKKAGDQADFPRMPEWSQTEDTVRFTVTLLTPGRYRNTCSVIQTGPKGIPGRCISASIGKMVSLGGWDLKRCRPRRSVSLLPAGCTWFYEAKVEQLDQIKGLHGTFTGEMNAYGMGQIAIGTWQEGTR